MKRCPYCGYSNYDQASECRKCQASFLPQGSTPHTTSHWFGPEKARALRSKALAAVVLGLMMWVYWGGHGPWQVIDTPRLAGVRSWLEPLLIFGGGFLYVLGIFLQWV